MDQFRDIVIDAWKEACRHIEIAESTARIAEILRRRLPVSRLVVRSLDANRQSVETVAFSDLEDRSISFERRELSPSQCKRALAWIERGQTAPWNPGGPADDDSRDMAALVAPEVAGPAQIVPLRGEHATLGVLIVEARDGAAFSADQVRMIALLREPFAAALENSERLHELRALRETAEADKRSLLRRLGRDKLVDEIVGADGGLKNVLERVGLVAGSDAPVLILGETGSGKEVIARAIHGRSSRATGPFIRVNCGALPPELIDSELFGHEKGAFTGAMATRRGWFERADEGTLFLDEIGELPKAAQVRLLRVVQEGTFQRVGGEQPCKVNVRIVTATHRDLPAMVQAGQFREDLWYRIAVFPVVLPPLREHKQDIPALAAHFARRAAKRFGLALQMPTAEETALLESYDWPGNIRELASVIDRAAILGDGQRLEIARAIGTPSAAPAPVAESASNPPLAMREVVSLDMAMRHYIEDVLRQTHGRIEGKHGAADLLKINPHTLRARMRKLQIDWARFRTT